MQFIEKADIFHICFFLDIPKVQKEPSLWFPILFYLERNMRRTEKP